MLQSQNRPISPYKNKAKPSVAQANQYLFLKS